MRMVKIGDFLTDEETKAAIDLYKFCASKGFRFAKECEQQIVRPAIDRINQTLGQENDPLFLAYLIEAAISNSISQGEQ